MTGEWGGTRHTLQAMGIGLRAHYISESAANPVGGLRQGSAYAHQVDAGFDLDLGKLIGLPGGKIHATFTERAGQSLAAQSIGNIISVQEIFGSGQNIRLAGLSYAQKLFEERIEAKLGWIHASDDFASSPIYCHFQNNGFCGQIGIVINSGFTIFPTGSWGSVVRANVRDDLYLQAGIYEVNPTLSLAANGFKLGTSGATGVIVPGEIGWQPRLGPAALPAAHIRIGGYYDTSDAPYLGSPLGGPQSTMRGRWGFYLQADQMLHRTTPGSDQGLTAFAVMAYGGPDTAMLQSYWQLGFLQKGTFTDRPQDTIGLAVNQVRISSQLVAAQNLANAQIPGSVAVQSAETAIELNYRAQLTPWSTVMPNIQYVMQPNAVTTIPNALVLGLQVRLTF
ncbi:MAG: carbohydrate porin [Reyranella sp.]|nr:carbohydrate porin [Reyranella sp.]